MESNNLFYTYNNFLKEKYNTKVIKLTIHLPTSCPNRQMGKICTFCGENGTLTGSISRQSSITRQLEENSRILSRKYNATSYIGYFQNYTNTYLSVEEFRQCMEEAASFQGIIMLSISTRPDCIRKDYLDILKNIKETYHVDICIELGLQSINPVVLENIQRGHSLAEYIESVLLIKSYGFLISTHFILNLPGDELIHIKEAAKIISALGVDLVKLHSLHIVKKSLMAIPYQKGEIKICSKEEYYERVGIFLDYLYPGIGVERLFSRIDDEESLFHNWNVGGWQMHNEIREYFIKNNHYQGKMADYLGGKGLTFLSK